MQSVSTLGMSYRTRSMISNAQAQIAILSGEMGSGIKNDVAASVGTRLGENITTRNLFDQITEYGNNIDLLKSRMDTMSNAYDGVEKVASDFFGKLSTMQGGDSGIDSVMQAEALDVIGKIAQQLNISIGDRNLFSGVDISKQPLQSAGSVNPATGISPMDAMAQMFGMVPPTDAASAQALADLISKAFSNDPSVPANLRFEGTFYNGTPALDASGNPNPRVTGRIDQQNVVDYGAQANDAGFRDLLRGAFMIAATDPKTMPKEAYNVILAQAFDAVGKGLNETRQDLAALAGHQTDLTAQDKVNDDRLKVMNSRLVGFESVNLIDANAQMTILDTQLQASMVLTNKMASLSIAALMLNS